MSDERLTEADIYAVLDECGFVELSDDVAMLIDAHTWTLMSIIAEITGAAPEDPS